MRSAFGTLEVGDDDQPDPCVLRERAQLCSEIVDQTSLVPVAEAADHDTYVIEDDVVTLTRHSEVADLTDQAVDV